MNSSDQVPLPAETAMPPRSSLPARLADIFVFPGEVFDSVKGQPHLISNWLVPVLLACVAGVIYTFVIFSQEATLSQMRELREKAIQKQVETGKLTPEQARQGAAAAERFATPALMKAFGSVGAVAGAFGWWFTVSLLIWLLCRFVFKADVPFHKPLEVVGLSTMIGVLGSLVSMLLVVGFGNLFVSPSPVLFLPEFDPANRWHHALAALNVITIWQMAVIALGAAKLAAVSFARAALWVFGIWAVFQLAVISSGLGAGGL